MCAVPRRPYNSRLQRTTGHLRLWSVGSHPVRRLVAAEPLSRFTATKKGEGCGS